MIIFSKNKTGLKRICMMVILFIFVSGFTYSQQAILLSYQRNFLRASLQGKPAVLTDAATDIRSGEFIGALYEFALKYIYDTSTILRDDPDMIALMGTIIRGIRTSDSRDSAETLWNVFLTFRDPYSRIEILETFISFGSDPWFINNMNQYVLSQNASMRMGQPPEYTTFSACISALGVMADRSSYQPLFDGYLSGYPQRINLEIQRTLELIDGNYRAFISDIIRNRPPAEKRTALRLGTQGSKLNTQEKGELAQIALEIGLNFIPGDSDADAKANINAMCYEAIRVIADLKWTRATSFVIRHFYMVQADYQRDPSLRSRYLESIACLGMMGTSESAQALALQLGYYNSRAEHAGENDNEVVLALVNALGEIGDKSAYDYLLYISQLNYPEQIQAAARNALNRLQW